MTIVVVVVLYYVAALLLRTAAEDLGLDLHAGKVSQKSQELVSSIDLCVVTCKPQALEDLG
jgi:hypothetical protein